jgi:hypothetical protein
LRKLRSQVLTTATVAEAPQANLSLKIQCAGLRGEILSSAGVAEAPQRKFKLRKRCGASATKFYRKNPIPWIIWRARF